MAEYRVRECLTEVCNGWRCWRERRFGAERRLTLFGLKLFWWPVIDFEWRANEQEAISDMRRDAELRSPLKRPRIFEVS